MRRSRGNLIISLTLTGLCLILAFTCLAIGFAHCSFCAVSANQLRAQELAESVVSQVLAGAMEDPAFGTPGHPGYAQPIRLEQDDGEGVVTFQAVDDLPVSSNSLTSPGAANLLRVVGVGRAGGVERRVEVVYNMPQFPYAIAASGTVKATGAFLVAGMLREGNTLTPDGPGSLASNAGDPTAVHLSSQSKVTGDVRTPGGVEMDPGATVLGEVRTPADAAAIPELSIPSFKPEGSVPALGSSFTNPTLDGFHQASGNFRVEGDLTLNSAFLYVAGNLTVTGGIRGKGAILSEGAVVVKKGAQLESGDQNQVALLAGGDVELYGTGQAGSVFQGQIYTQGNLHAENIKLVGTFATQGSTSEVGQASFKDVTLIQDSASSRTEFTITTTTGGGGGGGGGGGAPGGAGPTLFFGPLGNVNTGESYDGTPDPNFELGVSVSGGGVDPATGEGSFTIHVEGIGGGQDIEVTGSEEDFLNNVMAAALQDPSAANFTPEELANMQAAVHNLFHPDDPVPVDGPPPPSNPPPPPVPPTARGYDSTTHRYVFDMNEFLTPEQRLRLQSWRRLN